MTVDTLTKDKSLELMQAEIERLRRSLDDHLDSEAAETRRADRERDRARLAEAEIERLRGLLREGLEFPGGEPEWLRPWWDEEWKNRVREALGE